MYTRQQIQKKGLSNSASKFVNTSLFQQRPFNEETDTAGAPSHPQEQPDLQTQLEKAARFGHNFSQVQVNVDTPSSVIQPKLAIGAPGDKYEQEADQVAQQVMSIPAPVHQPSIQREMAPEKLEEAAVQTKPLAASITPLIQREMAPESEEEEPLQTKPLAGSTIQREIAPETEEEEPLQTKPLTGSTIQREIAPETEEEEPLQTKPLTGSTIQREMALESEEEEPLQTKLLAGSTIQREIAPESEEEEPLQTKPLAGSTIQREIAPESEEEEPLQTKPLAGSTIQREMELETEEEEPLQTKPLAGSMIQREIAPESEEEEPLQTKRSPDGNTSTSSNLENQLNTSKGGGNPLSDEVRSFMEPRFGADFSQVRVHTDSQAVQMNKDLGAQAFTHGSDIYFGAGKSPGISDLTAHELTHVVQQTGGIQLKCSTCEAEEATRQPSLEVSSTAEVLQKREVCDADGVCWSEPDDDSYETSTSEEANYTSGEVYNPIAPEELNYTPAPEQEPTPTSTKTNVTSSPAQIPGKTEADVIDPAKVTAAADALFKAIDGWGTDEDAILKALAGKSPAEMEAIKKEYAAHYNGRDLEKDLESELSGDDFKEAQAKLSGDQATAAISALSNSIGVFNDDEAKIEETLSALSPDDLKKMQEMAANNPAIKQKLDNVLSYLGGEDREVAEALLKGNKEEAAAARIAEAIIGAGTDEKAVYKYMEGKKPEELEKIKAAYLKKTGRTLAADIVDDFSDAEKDQADALLSGDKTAAAAAQIKGAAEGLGTDEKGIYDQLKGKSQEERDALIKAYEAKYGEGSFEAMLKDEMEDDELKQAQQYQEKGQLDPGYALKLAISGLGTDEELIKETLKGKTPEEIKTIREAYNKETNGGNLDLDLGSDIDGRDAFEVGQMLKGKPQNAQEHYERAMERYEFERGEGSTWFSLAMMNASQAMGMHSKGEMLDYQTQRLQEMFDEKGQLKPPFTQKDVEQIAGYQETDATNYKEAKEAVSNAVSTGGTIAVAALVTVCTKGAAAPWLVAVISGAAGGGANMAIKYGMQGAAYGGEDIAIEALTSAIAAAMGGALADKTKFLAKLEDIVKSLGEDMAKKVALEALKGTVKGATMGALQETMNDKNWRQGLADYLEGIAKGAAVGGVVGGVTSAATATVEAGLENKTSTALIKAGAGVVGAGVGEGVNAIKGDYKGRLEDLLGRLLVAGVSAGAEEQVTSAAAKARLRGIAQMVVAVGDDMPKVQQILEAQVKYLEPEDAKTLKAMILTEVMSQVPDTSQSQVVNRPESHYATPY